MKNSIVLLGIFFLLGSNAARAIECPQGHYRVREHNRSGYLRSDGAFVRPSHVNEYCKPLSLGYEFTKDRFQNGMLPQWPHKVEKDKAWTEADKERVIDALDELPDFLLTPKLKGFYRLLKSKDHPNPASNAEDIIALYDTAFQSSRNLARILARELSHQQYLSLSVKDQQDYRRETGWHLEVEARNVYWIGRRDGYVEEDGKRSHAEDFANNLEYFLYNPDKLKKVTPAAYQWMKKHFGDSFKLKEKKK